MDDEISTCPPPPRKTAKRPPTPPDGGWGWVVVASAFFVNVLLSGDTSAFPVLLPELSASFQSSPSVISWAGSLRYGLCCVTGPLVGRLINRHGCKVATLLGTIVVFLGGVAASLAPDVTLLILLLGVIQGIGVGFAFLPPIVAVGTYFEKRRAIATGVASCGAGIGGVFFPPLIKYLAEEWSWRGAVLVNAALMLHVGACALLFRKLEDNSSEEVTPMIVKLNYEDTRRIVNDPVSHDSLTLVNVKNSFDSIEIEATRKSSLVSVTPTPQPSSRRSSRVATIESSLLNSPIPEEPSSEEVESRLPAIVEDLVDDGDGKSATSWTDANRKGMLHPLYSPDEGMRSFRSSGSSKGILHRRDIQFDPFDLFLSSSRRNSRRQTVGFNMNAYYLIENRGKSRRGQHSSKIDHKRFSLHSVPTKVSLAWIEGTGSEPDPDVALKYRPPRLKTSTRFSWSKPSDGRPKQHKYRPLDRKDVLYGSSILNLDHFESKRSGVVDPRDLISVLESPDDDVADEMTLSQSPSFWVHCVVNAVYMFAFCIPTTFLVDYASSVGVAASESSYLLSLMGCVGCCVRIGVGFVADMTDWRGIRLSGAGMVLGGVATLVAPALPMNFLLLAVYASVFTVGSGTYLALQSIVIVDLFGIERLTDGFGALQLFRGIGAMIGPPLGGYVVDVVGHYGWTFGLSGILMIASGLAEVAVDKMAAREGARRRRINKIKHLEMLLISPKDRLI